jgi:hypothetical protein
VLREVLEDRERRCGWNFGTFFAARRVGAIADTAHGQCNTYIANATVPLATGYMYLMRRRAWLLLLVTAFGETLSRPLPPFFKRGEPTTPRGE